MDIIERIPLPYLVLAYCPCYGVTPLLLKNAACSRVCVRVCRSLLGLTHPEHAAVLRAIRGYDFTNAPVFRFETEGLYLEVYPKKRKKDPAYLLLLH